ncbi:hypothetical protein [Vibrio taketomensis]|uniref:hypothetical protein n=1 Tax=Vibrio taketomensis TaxID=2572923 RepID=UPI0013898C01|nr:hypothetical protein [Vibrio taketomensis]
MSHRWERKKYAANGEENENIAFYQFNESNWHRIPQSEPCVMMQLEHKVYTQLEVLAFLRGF